MTVKLLAKLISPIIYVTLFITTLIATIVSMATIGRSLRIGNEISGILAIIIVGGISFWIGNMVMEKIEGLKKPTILDHLRQSSGYYCGLFLGIKMWIDAPDGNHSSRLYAVVIIAFLICLWAICVNALYLRSNFRIQIRFVWKK